MRLAPIVLFVYNRLWHTKQTVEALQKNELAKDSELIIFSDAPKTDKHKKPVYEVREYIKTISNFKNITIIERDKNWGLANSIIDGITKIVNKYGKIIVLEDDLVTSQFFLTFMNEALEMYKNDKRVVSIHGYVYPIANLPDLFFLRGADCWGWATWMRGWAIFEADGKKLLSELKSKKLQKDADFSGSYGFTRMLKNQIKGKNDSWAIRWYFSTYLRNMLTLYPGKSLVRNIGMDNSGRHSLKTKTFDTKTVDHIRIERIEVRESREDRKKFEHFFKIAKGSAFKRTKQRIKTFL